MTSESDLKEVLEIKAKVDKLLIRVTTLKTEVDDRVRNFQHKIKDVDFLELAEELRDSCKILKKVVIENG